MVDWTYLGVVIGRPGVVRLGESTVAGVASGGVGEQGGGLAITEAA